MFPQFCSFVAFEGAIVGTSEVIGLEGFNVVVVVVVVGCNVVVVG